MNTEHTKLKQTIASRLTPMESVKFSRYVEKSNTTKSEMIRMLIINFLNNKSQNTN